jgi:hypothetical protein
VDGGKFFCAHDGDLSVIIYDFNEVVETVEVVEIVEAVESVKVEI